MAEYLQVLRRGLQQIRAHGGIFGSFWQFIRVSDLKIGALVGVDKYGNKYFEDKRYFFVVIALVPTEEGAVYCRRGGIQVLKVIPFYSFMGSGNQQLKYRLLCILTEPKLSRHRWLHSMTDEPPSTHPPVDRKFIWENHKFNQSGTSGQYVPYSTTRKKIEEWVPPQISRK